MKIGDKVVIDAGSSKQKVREGGGKGGREGGRERRGGRIKGLLIPLFLLLVTGCTCTGHL